MSERVDTEKPEFLIQTEIERPGGPQLQGATDRVIQGTEEHLKAAAALAGEAGTALRDVFRDLAPSTGTVEFSLTFEGEAGVPSLAKGKAGATLTVTLQWTAKGEQ